MRFRCYAVLVAAVLVIGCANKAPASLSPKGVTIWEANEAVSDIRAMRRGVADANAIQKCVGTPVACSPLVPDATVRVVLDASDVALRGLDKTPDGWRVIVQTMVNDLNARLTAAGKQELAEWIALGGKVLKR